MNSVRLLFLVLFGVLFMPSLSHAETGCTLIISYPNANVLYEDGDCAQRAAPASSFKIPLALMGFDAGLLVDAHTPLMPYEEAYQSTMQIQKKPTDPTIWMKDSIVWYSQQMTQSLGVDAFQKYVDQFDYGNRDISGGLTRAWLGQSLEISPREQVQFLTKLLNGELGVSKNSTARVIAIMPEFASGEWTVFGKTGTSWSLGADGEYDRTKPLGWFVGWADKDDERVVFAKLVRGDQRWDGYGGPVARDAFLKDLPGFRMKTPQLP